MSVPSARRPAPLWHVRWAARVAVALAPVGALVGLVGVAVVEREPVPALVAYAAGAAAAAAVGFVLGGVAGAVRLRLFPPRPRRRPVSSTGWVLHRVLPPHQTPSLTARR